MKRTRLAVLGVILGGLTLAVIYAGCGAPAAPGPGVTPTPGVTATPTPAGFVYSRSAPDGATIWGAQPDQSGAIRGTCVVPRSGAGIRQSQRAIEIHEPGFFDHGYRPVPRAHVTINISATIHISVFADNNGEFQTPPIPEDEGQFEIVAGPPDEGLEPIEESEPLVITSTRRGRILAALTEQEIGTLPPARNINVSDYFPVTQDNEYVYQYRDADSGIIFDTFPVTIGPEETVLVDRDNADPADDITLPTAEWGLTGLVPFEAPSSPGNPPEFTDADYWTAAASGERAGIAYWGARQAGLQGTTPVLVLSALEPPLFIPDGLALGDVGVSSVTARKPEVFTAQSDTVLDISYQISKISTPEEPEPIEVPAGSFDDYIVLTLSLENRFFDMWLAKGIGIIRTVDYSFVDVAEENPELEGPSGIRAEGTIEELVSYTLAGEPPVNPVAEALLIDITSHEDGQTVGSSVQVIQGCVHGDPLPTEVQVTVGTANPATAPVDQETCYWEFTTTLPTDPTPITVTATNSENETGTVTINLHPPAESAEPPLHARLTWDTNNNDCDLYVVPPDNRIIAYFQMNGSGSSNGGLDFDNVYGYGPENVSFGRPLPDGTYLIGANWYANHGGGPTTVTIEVFKNGIQMDSDSKLLTTPVYTWSSGDSPNGYFAAFTVEVVGGQVDTVTRGVAAGDLVKFNYDNPGAIGAGIRGLAKRAR